MATVKVYDQNKQESGDITLSSDVFEVEVRPEILNLVVRAQMAAKRGVDVYYIGTLEAEGVTTIHVDNEDEEDPDSISLRVVPKNTLVYEISGPMFFAAAGKILNISVEEGTKVLIIRMRGVNAIDATAMHNMEQLYETCAKKGITMVLSHVNSQPRSVMKKAGFDKKIGLENFCAHIDDALKRAEDLQ